MAIMALPFTHPPPAILVEPIVRRALEEDLGLAGDLTSELAIGPASRAARLVARQSGAVCGLAVAECAFHLIDGSVGFRCERSDGSMAQSRDVLATVEGPARAMLAAERVALNFMGHLSGVATATRTLVDAIAGTKARIVCTRKTLPGLRVLEKYAVRCGGGFNHRFGLYDAVLIKDNHIAAAGGIRPAVEQLRAAVSHMVRIEVEVDTLEQLEEALALLVDAILLDNMTLDELGAAVEMARGTAILEASGNVTAANVRAIAKTGVDCISSGAMTHSAPALDVALDFDRRA